MFFEWAVFCDFLSTPEVGKSVFEQAGRFFLGLSGDRRAVFGLGILGALCSLHRSWVGRAVRVPFFRECGGESVQVKV
jgi:hypothetical protein